MKRLERQIKESTSTLSKLIIRKTKSDFFCRPDAEAAASQLQQQETKLHHISVKVEEKISYVPGRPPKNGKRKVSCIRYILNARIEENSEQIKQKREESGCFVLLTNVLQG